MNDSAAYSLKTTNSMVLLRSIAYKSLWFLILILPLWVGFGRALFGVEGFFILLTLFLFAPAVFISQVAVAILTRTNPIAHQSRQVSRRLAVTILILIISHIIFQISIVDGGDTKESIGSVITNLGGPSDLSGFLTAISVFTIIITTILEIIFAALDNITASQHLRSGKVEK